MTETYIMNCRIFAKNLAYYLDRSGKTQKELAENIGVPATTFNCWMKARKYPRIDKIERLANYFGINKEDLIEEKTSPDGAEMSSAKRQILDLVMNCSEEDATTLLEVAKLYLKK